MVATRVSIPRGVRRIGVGIASRPTPSPLPILRWQSPVALASVSSSRRRRRGRRWHCCCCCVPSLRLSGWPRQSCPFISIFVVLLRELIYLAKFLHPQALSPHVPDPVSVRHRIRPVHYLLLLLKRVKECRRRLIAVQRRASSSVCPPVPCRTRRFGFRTPRFPGRSTLEA